MGEFFGCDAAIVTRIRHDPHGQQIEARLHASKLDLTGLQFDELLPTGFVDVVLNQGQPDYTIGRQVAWDRIEFDEAANELAQRAAAVCFGTLVQLGEVSTFTLSQFLNTAKSAIKILDLNLRKPLPSLATVEFSLNHADVLKCNLEELQQLAVWFSLEEKNDGKTIAAQLQDRFDLQTVFWTRGADGCCWQSGTACVTAEVPKFEAEPHADSVGAGDAASAALAIGLVLGWKPERIVMAANLCGAFAASKRGATAPMTDEVLMRIS